MKIAFVTTQSLLQSTVVGRILPVAKELGKMGNEVTVLVHEEASSLQSSGSARGNDPVGVHTVSIGYNPFTRTESGKKRKRGFALLFLMFGNAIRGSQALLNIRPDIIVIVKPLPENVFAVSLARLFLPKSKIVLDVDDFELFANVVSSLPERAVLHWAERRASSMAQHVIAATPFLADHMRAIAQKDVPITLIPTGLSVDAAMQQYNSHVIAYIGSVSASSGHLIFMLPEIVEQVRKGIPDATILIAGSGDDEKKLKQLFSEKNLDSCVEWFGRFSDVDIPNILSKASIIVDPIDDSIVNRAKSSYRAMLACSSALPVVTSNIGIRPIVIPEVLHSRFFADVGSTADYAERIVDLLRHPLSEEDKKALHNKSAEYSYQKTAELYYNCLV